MSKSKIKIPDDKLSQYDKLVESNSQIERKGKTMPYTSINGNMFSFLSKEGVMGLRLSQEDREDFIKKFNSKLMVQYGRTMKEYVEIPDDLLKNTKRLSAFLQKSLDYATTLKPKSTKKKK